MTQKKYYNITIYNVDIIYYLPPSEIYKNIKNHWIQCGGSIEKYAFIGDSNTVKEFYLTSNLSLPIQIKEYNR